MPKQNERNEWVIIMSFIREPASLLQFLILLPAAASCYLPAKEQMKYSAAKTAALCIGFLVPYSLGAAWAFAALDLDVNIMLLPSLALFFPLYRCTVDMDFPRCLAIYVGVCAIETFPAQFAYSFDAHLHPDSGAGNFSPEAALFQLGLSCLMAAAFAWPAARYFSWAVSHLDFPKIWYSTVALSSVFLIFNVLAIPWSYSTLKAGRLSYLFPMLEGCALAVLTIIYMLFYQGARLILNHAELKERSRLLELESRQYRSLQMHMQQTARLRHDFRHSLRLLSSLAEQGDIRNIQMHLAEYSRQLAGAEPGNYCRNAALNALFGYYHEMAHGAGIETDWKIGLPEPLTVSELDLASLFGNLLENAIDGCQSLPEGSRYSCLTAEVLHGRMLYVVSTNSFRGEVKKGKDGYCSTKHSGKGMGLASIGAVAEKYHGKVQVSHSGEEFFVDVVLKL